MPIRDSYKESVEERQRCDSKPDFFVVDDEMCGLSGCPPSARSPFRTGGQVASGQ